MRRYLLAGALTCAITLALSTSTWSTSNPPFDFHSDNAAIAVVIPQVIDPLFETTTPNDAPIILRHTTEITNAWFDAIAPYHATAVGVYSRLGRRPPAESATNQNLNIAILYASYRVLNSLMPRYAANWRDMLSSVGLDPANDSEDLTTAIGIGNAAGRAVAAARERDGMNQLGDEGGRVYDRRPYQDYTGYTPVNSPWTLRNPSRWQPLFLTSGNGTFLGQQHITPQWALTRPYSYSNPQAFAVVPPVDSDHRRRASYQAQADEVMAMQAALTDREKMIAELFDNKIRSLGFSAVFVALSRGLSLAEFVHYDFLTNMAAFDGGIATWQEKMRYDAVRPVTAIRYLYGDRSITGWAGPGRGIVNDLPGSEWRSYLGTANHSEYPSGSACFCAAHAQASRRFLGDDILGWQVPVAAGSSVIEPGTTPSADLVLEWPTFTEFERDCGMSRFWGGVHFRAAITSAQQMCRPIGDGAYEFLQRQLRGEAR